MRYLTAQLRPVVWQMYSLFFAQTTGQTHGKVREPVEEKPAKHLDVGCWGKAGGSAWVEAASVGGALLLAGAGSQRSINIDLARMRRLSIASKHLAHFAGEALGSGVLCDGNERT